MAKKIENVTDLTVETRQAIADKAKAAGMTAEQVKTQLDKVGVETPAIKTTPPETIVDTPVEPVIKPQIKTDLATGQATEVETGKDVTPLIKPVEIKKETTPVVTDKTTTTPKVDVKTDEITAPQTIEEWKTQGSNITTLEEMIEGKYNTVAENVNGVLTADIDGVKYEWNIDDTGNPIKTKVGGENPDTIFTQLMAGQTIADTGIKTTKQYSTAKARYDITSKYNSMTEDQLYNAFINGEINSKLEQDLVNNPFLAGAKEKYNQKIITDGINNESTTILNAYNKANGNDVTETEDKNFLQDLSDKILASYTDGKKDVSSFQDYMDTNYPDLITDTAEYNSKNTTLKELADVRDSRIDDIIADNPGISINKATMLAARQNKDINAQIKSMSYELTELGNNINYQSSIADKEYGYELDRQARQDVLDREERSMAFDILKTEEQRAYEEANKGVSTSIINVGDKQQLINSQTGEVIKEYDLATGTSGTADKWSKLDDNTLYNQATGEFKDRTTGEITSPTGAITTGTGQITQNYGATSPVTQDNVTLADGNVGTPGVDIDGAIGDPIPSYSNGTVVALHEVNESGGFGRRLIVKDEEGNLHVYNHLQGSNVHVGDTVKRGQTIAAMGNTGTVIAGEGGDGSHLDYRVSDNGSFALNGGNWIDPNQFMGEQVKPEQEFSQDVQDIGQAILRGESKISDLTGTSNEALKKEVLLYTATNKAVYDDTSDVVVGIQDRINALDAVLEKEGVLEDVAGARRGFIANMFTDANSQLLKKFQFLLDQEGLQNLIKLKGQGATFGSLTEKEMSTLRNSASALNAAVERNDKDIITGFDMSDKEFIQTIKDFNTTLKKAKSNLMGGVEQSTGNTITSTTGNTYTY